MRLLMIATTTFLLAGSSADAAPDYPWCQRTANTGGTPQCVFNTYQQCQVTISGVGGDCVQNPYLAFGQASQAGSDRPLKRIRR